MRWGDDEQFRRRSFLLAFLFISIFPIFLFFLIFFFKFTSGAALTLCGITAPPQTCRGGVGGQEYGARASQPGAFDEAALRNLM